MILRVKTLLGIFILFGLIACGGGGGLEREGTSTGGGTTTGGTTTVTRSINLVFSNTATSELSTSLSEESPLRLTATATDSNGNAVTDTLITYTFQPEGLAVFVNDSGTARTGTDGVAILDILVGDDSGAGEIIATLSSGETATTTYISSGTTQVNEEPIPDSLQLFSSSIQLASSGSDKIELLALVKDENNVLLENINVTFSANAGANLELPDGGSVAVTGKDGIARAFLNTLNQPENRTIRVLASAAGLPETQTLDIQVVGTEININGAASLIINDSAPITINLVDSDGKGIANQTVNISAQNGILSDVIATTSESGQISINYTASIAGQDTINASSLNANGIFELVVQQDDFAFTAQPDDAIELGNDAVLSITWLKDNTAFVNGNVALASSRGTVLVPNSVTDVNGVVNFTIQSDNAGFASVSATGVDSNGEQVTARTEVEFVATVADNIIVDGTPDSIGPSGQASTITAVVRDPNGNLVKGKVVNFVVDDVSGGNISPSQATTDRSGIASVVYTSNAVSSFEAVKVHATVADTPTVSGYTLLTVGDRAFDISIGTGRLMDAPEQSSYAKEFTVFVTDPNSNPVPNAAITFSAPPVKFTEGGVYRKGYWLWDDLEDIWYQNITATCPNEDINGNGILDAGEDENGDDLLTPGNVVSIPSGGTTDENGQKLINILYAKQFGGWVEVDIAAKAESAGSESEESQRFSLPVLVADMKVDGSPPPSSPYGNGSNCTDTN